MAFAAVWSPCTTNDGDKTEYSGKRFVCVLGAVMGVSRGSFWGLYIGLPLDPPSGPFLAPDLSITREAYNFVVPPPPRRRPFGYHFFWTITPNQMDMEWWFSLLVGFGVLGRGVILASRHAMHCAKGPPPPPMVNGQGSTQPPSLPKNGTRV